MKVEDAVNTICEKEPFFASLVTKLKIIEDKQCPTMGTDGENLFYNPEFIKKLSEGELCGVVLHETLHCAYRHLWRREKRQHLPWNVACDFAINTTVNEFFPLPKGACLDAKYYGMSAEEIYDSFPRKKVKEQGWGDHSEWEDGEGDKKKQGKSLLDKLFKKRPKATKSHRERKADWERRFKKSMLEHYGDAPNSIKRIIEKNYYMPVLDWTQLVSQLLSEDTNDYTFSQPDRRFMEADFFLPGLSSIDRLKDVIFAYDTSGSISEEQLRSFYMETMNLFANFSSLQGWVAVCDSYLHRFHKIDAQATFKDFGFIGGGGTSFEPVFQRIKREGIQPKALFYFTDTEGYFPPEKPDYPVFWLVQSQIGSEAHYQVPYGTVIPFLPKRS